MSAPRSDVGGSDPAALRRDAEAAAGRLPPLLARARRLAAAVPGEHGRRRAGPGDTFWQYRRAGPGDPMSAIDWRRSGHSDELFVRETEWAAAQTVWLWADASQAMTYRAQGEETKARRAALIGLGLAALLSRSGERFGLLGGGPALHGEAGLRKLALHLDQAAATEDFGAPPAQSPTRGSQAVFLSDFFGPLAPLETALRSAADRGVGGALLQIVDPAEESLPFSGRVLFESMTGRLRYDATRADALAEDYRARLAQRRATLRAMAARAGWRFAAHRTDASPAAALLWLHGAIGARRRAQG